MARNKGRSTNRATETTSSRPSQRAKALRGPASARGRQVIRQLSILRLLETSHRGLTVAELHQAITDGDGDSCTQRTIYRDVEQLQ